MDRADITIIGAGVIGLAIAARVANEKRDVYVLEKNSTFGQETSSRQSEVIHSGIYYPKDSLKARLCVEGKTLLYELCERHQIAHKRLGKIIVATDESEIEQLKVLLDRGVINGVTGLKMLSGPELGKLEPNMRGVAALFSPSTGIIDSYALMRYFLGKAKNRGARIVYKSKVVGIERVGSECRVVVRNGMESFSFMTRVLINCAGLESDKVAKLAGIDVGKADYKLHYCKGEYFSLASSKAKLVRHLIYPVPQIDGAGLGIHVTLSLEGRVRLGPNARYVDEIDYAVDSSQKKGFYESVRKFLPFIEYDDLEPEMAGIRPKLQGPGEDFRDFIIRDEYEKGLPGLINLVGIESPGLTASPAIAEYVGSIVDKAL